MKIFILYSLDNYNLQFLIIACYDMYMQVPIYLVLRNKFIYIPIVLFLAISGWWLYIGSFDLNSTENARQIWAAIYQIMALYGGIAGLIISKNWGGYRSTFGRAILFFSLSLFLQSFGQSTYSYYIFFQKIEVPYPSIGDIGFFGSVVAYIYAVVLLSKLSGAKINLRSAKGKLISLLIPLGMLVFSYLFFLQGYDFDWSNKLKIFLDFAYPLGEAIYVSIAILTLVMSKNVLGGLMKRPILFLIFALIFQYISDFTFLYQASKGTWYVGGLNDYLYFVSYLLMTTGLIYLDSVFEKIKEG